MPTNFFPDAPFAFRSYKDFRFKIRDENKDKIKESLETNGFCIVSLTQDANEEHDFESANRILGHLLAEVGDLGDVFEQDPKTKTKTSTRASHHQRIKHLFHVFSGATARERAVKEGEDAAKVRYNDFERYPNMHLSRLRPLWPAHKQQHTDPAALENYLSLQVTGVDLQHYLFGDDDKEVKVQLTNTYHPIPHHVAAPKHSALYPVCPVNPHTLDDGSSYRCHLAVTTIPFVAVLGSHKTEFLQPLEQILRKYVTEDQLADPTVGFQLPFATPSDGIDPLHVFEKQVALKIPRGNLIVCHPALSYVPLEHTCAIQYKEPQWACSFMLTGVPYVAPARPAAAAASLPAAAGPEEGGDTTATETGAETADETMTAEDEPPKIAVAPRAKRTHAKAEPDFAELAARKTHKTLTRPARHTHFLSQPTIPAVGADEGGALRERITDTEHALRTAASDNERGVLSMQLKMLRELLKAHERR
jgi:hypothetical protein